MDKDIESHHDTPQPTRPEEDIPQPIVIRKLDRLETTQPSSMNGG
jgi:hypothetical protein